MPNNFKKENYAVLTSRNMMQQMHQISQHTS